MRVRLKDVAQRAGVSVATVSRVIHSETASSNPSKTAQRVQQAIADLGYQSDKNINLEHKNADFGAASRRLGCMLLGSGEINHSGSGENRQFWSNENHQSGVASPQVVLFTRPAAGQPVSQ